MTSTLPPLVQALSGAIGSASANVLTYPLDLVATRLQLQVQPSKKSTKPSKNLGGIHGAYHILRHIVLKNGAAALYDGLLVDTAATLLSNFLYFYFYTFLRNFVSNRRRLKASSTTAGKLPPIVKLSVFQELLLGFIAGVASRAVSTPLNIVTLRLQTERSNQNEDDEDELSEDPDSNSDASVGSVVKLIYDEQGLAGFWRGFKTTTLLSLNPSITLAFFQLFRRALLGFRFHTPSANGAPPNPTPRQAFTGAAISNSIAVTLLYPLILAKTRLQARRKSLGTSNRAPSRHSSSLTSVLVDAYLGRVPSENARRRQAGIQGLYQGLEMQIIKGFFSQGVAFLVKGRIEQLIVTAYLRRQARLRR